MTEHTIEEPAVKRLERSRSDRMLVGVCGGLARYFGIHPAFYRVGFVVLTLLGGAGVLIYIAAALVIPDEGHEDSIASAALRDRRDRPWPLIGLALLGVAATVLLSRATLWPHGDAAWVLLLLAGAFIFLLTRRHPQRKDDTVPPPTAGAEAPTRTMDTTALAREDSRRMRRAVRTVVIALGALVALLLIAATIFAAVFHVHLSHGVGHQTYNVAGITDLREDYKLGIGDLRVDLSNVELPIGETHVTARVDVGQLRVIVPPDAALRVRGDADVGEVNLLGSSWNGRDVDKSVDQSGKRILVLNAHVGVGSVRIDRAVR